MGQVMLSLEEYNELRDQARKAAAVRDCLMLEKSYNGNVELAIDMKKAAETFRILMEGSQFKDTHTVMEDPTMLDTYTIATYSLRAVPNETLEEDPEELEDPEEPHGVPGIPGLPQ